MSTHAAITVLRPRAEIERLWNSPEHRSEYLSNLGATVRFADAPGDRGTEIHVEVADAGPAGRLPEPLRRLAAAPALARVKDELRRFKRLVETGEVPTAQEPELEAVGAR